MHGIHAKINVFELKTKIQGLLAEFPELSNDQDLRLDTLEGETELFEVLSIILENIRNAGSMQDAIELRLKDLKDRKDRYEQRENGWRKLAKELMDVASLRTVILPEATLSIRHGQPSVHIFDHKQLPESFWRIKREPNLSKIKDELKTGEQIPGAMLNNAPDYLAISTK